MNESGKLLVIDEETYLLRNFVQLAESAGYCVEGSPDAGEGWDLARRLRPDIILVNTLPPQGTGQHLCRQVKADPALANAAIMMLAADMRGDSAQPDLPGIDVDEYVLKPITSRDLLARVQAMLRVQHSEAQLAQIRKELQEKQALLVTVQQQLRTSQKQTRQVLSAAQKREPAPPAALADLYETLPIGCCTVDKYGLILEANTLAAQQCGSQRGKFVETLFPDYIADADVGVFFEHLAHVFESGQPQTCEITLKTGQPQVRTVRLETRIRTAARSEEPARCTVTLTDVTTYVTTVRRKEQQAAELQRKLDAQQKRHRRQTLREQRKQQEEQQLRAQQTLQEQQKEHEREKEHGRRKRVLQAQQEEQIKALLQTQERLQTTIETHYVSQETYDGKVHELHRIQERLQNELNIERCQFQAILDSVNDGVTLCDITGYFEVFNPRMEEMTGYSHKEANTHMDFQLVLYADPQRHHQAVMRMAAITASGEPQSCITSIRAKDGTEKILAVYTTRLKCDQQEWLLSTYQDITEYRKLKQKLIRSQKHRRKNVRV